MNSIFYVIFVPSIGLAHKFIYCCTSYKDLQNQCLICVLMTESESKSAQSHTNWKTFSFFSNKNQAVNALGQEHLTSPFCALPREMGCWSRTVVFDPWHSDTAGKRSTEGDQNRKNSILAHKHQTLKGIPTGYLFCTSKTEVSFKPSDSGFVSVNVISTLKNDNIAETIHFVFCKVDFSRKSAVR